MNRDEANPRSPPRRRHRLRWWAPAVPLLILLALGWLLNSQSGLRWLLRQAAHASHGSLTVAAADGRLLGNLQLHGIHYHDEQGTQLQVETLSLAWRPRELLHRRLHLTMLSIRGIKLQLPPASSAAEAPGDADVSLRPPWGLQFVLDQAAIQRFVWQQAGTERFRCDQLQLSGRWDTRQLRLNRLSLAAPDGELALHGQLSSDSRYLGAVASQFHWQLGEQRLAGRIELHNDGRHAQAALNLITPVPARLQLSLQPQRPQWPWQAMLTAPRFALARLGINDPRLRTAALKLSAHGDRRRALASAELALDRYRLHLRPLALTYDAPRGRLQIEQLTLSSPDFSGQLHLHGTAQLQAEPISAGLQLDWRQVRLPPALLGRPLSSEGQLQIQGSLAHFSAQGALALGPPGQLSQLDLSLKGTPQIIDLQRLTLQQRQGDLQLQGQLQLQPNLGWQLAATAHHLDPGQLLPDWPGNLSFELHSQGQLRHTTPTVQLDLSQLSGQLRHHPLSGQGQLKLTADQRLSGQLRLQSSTSHLQLDATPGLSNHVALDLDLARLGDWWPGAQGRILGHLLLSGRLPALAVNGRLQLQTLRLPQLQLRQLNLSADIPDLDHPAGRLQLDAQDLAAGGMHFKSIHLDGHGSEARHSLSLDAQGQPLSLQLALSGSYRQPRWQGQLTRLDLHWPRLPNWSLLHPATLAYDQGQARLDQLCLAAGQPRLCLDASQTRSGELSASYRLQALPWRMILAAASSEPPPLRIEGQLQGQGALSRDAHGNFRGQAELTSPAGAIRYAAHPEQALLAYQALSLQARLDAGQQRLLLHAALSDKGHIDGQFTLVPATQALAGRLSFRIGSLGFIELLSPQLNAVHGHAGGDFSLSGTSSAPRLNGQAELDELAAELPAAGLRLSQGRLRLATTDAQHLQVAGSLHSGDGRLTLGGNLALAAGEASQLTLGGTRFTAVDIPAAKVDISPRLTLTRDAAGLNAQGQLSLDQAHINLDRLAGGSAGGQASSPDIVVVGEKPPSPPAALPISARINVDLGSDTRLQGKGLDGRLSGHLNIRQDPGQTARGKGEIAIDGSYRAYGQHLTIEHGRLSFADTPLANPGLDLRAYRKINPNLAIDDGQQVGLNISGSAQRPRISVYSKPAMNQSEALSYLITGKPMDQLNRSEGGAVNHAAQTLGSAAGDYLAKSIGSRLGLDDIGISSNDALNGNSAFSVGKYLSPRLYLSYGIGLFDPGQIITLRYRLSRRWNFETQNASQYNRASLNYHLER